jgi:WD40 repeat protein
MDQVEGKPVSGSDGMFFPEVSPAGDWIAAFAGASDLKLKKIPASGGTAITLADASAPLGVTWGDDETLVFSGGKGLMRVPSSGGAPQTLTTPDEKKGEAIHRTPHFLPGARAVLFTIASASSGQVAVLDLKKGAYHVVVNNGIDARYVPTGHLVYVRGGTLFAAPFDAGRLALTGPEAPVVENVSVNGPSGAFGEYSFADTGLLVYIQSAGQGAKTILGWVDRQGTVQPLSELELWGTGRLSPDGTRVANQIQAPTGKATAGDIWVWEVERRTRTRLTFEGENSNPIWTPDGRRITFGATVGGKAGIYWVPADGSGKPELLLATDTLAVPSCWLPDGKSLLFSQAAGGKPGRIWVAPFSGGKAGTPAPLHETTAFEQDAQLSPDGRWVAYASAEAGTVDIYAHPFPGPGAKVRISTQGANSVRWSRNGKELFYKGTGAEGYLMAVDVQTAPAFHVSLPHAVVKARFGTTWDPAPDGKRFLIEQVPSLEGGRQRLQGVSDWFEELRRRVPVKR